MRQAGRSSWLTTFGVRIGFFNTQGDLFVGRRSAVLHDKVAIELLAKLTASDGRNAPGRPIDRPVFFAVVWA
jgi:hypothetical protein